MARFYTNEPDESNCIQIVSNGSTVICIKPSTNKKKPRHKTFDLTDSFGSSACFSVLLLIAFVMGIQLGIYWHFSGIYPFDKYYASVIK